MRSRAGKIAQDRKGDGNGPVNLGMPELSVSRYGSSWDSEERLAFDFFQSQTSNQLSGVFRTDREMDIWSRMLLQGAYQSPEIKHAVCAFGAFHLNLWGKPNNDKGQTYLLAVHQYNKAIKSTIRSARHPNTSVAVVCTQRLVSDLGKSYGDVIEEIPLVWGSDASVNLDWFPSCSSDPFGHPSPGTTQEIHMNRPGKPILTFTPFSLLSALYTISFRCRDPTVRQLAVRLLQYIDWYDGFWDSKMCSRLAERIMQIVENGYLLGAHNSRCNQRVEKAEQILPNARCRQIRGMLNHPNVIVFEFSNINANEWVPEANH